MSEQSSRRNFLKRASIGAAVVGAGTLTPALMSSPADAHPLDAGAVHDGSFTVWVKDAKTGHVVVMAGESEVVYRDRVLARRLARLAARANS